MINAAIVGLGRWGKRLVDSVQQGGKPKGNAIRFTRAVAPTPAKVQAYAEEQHLDLTDDLRAVLDDPAINAVVLASPHDQHVGQIVAASVGRKHVFVEKPFALTYAGALEAVAATKAAGVVLALGHNRRFLPAMAQLKAMIDGGTLGTIVHLEGNFSGPFGPSFTGTWRGRETGVAAGITAMGVHLCDAFIHLCGPVAAVRCHGQRRTLTNGVDDTAMAVLRLRSGASAYFSTVVTTRRQWRLQVFGTDGWAAMRDHHLLDVYLADDVLRTTTYPAIDIEQAELEAFARAITGAAAYPLPLDQAAHGAAVLEALLASATHGGGEMAVA
jgi:predicted dehydrogenase